MNTRPILRHTLIAVLGASAVACTSDAERQVMQMHADVEAMMQRQRQLAPRLQPLQDRLDRQANPASFPMGELARLERECSEVLPEALALTAEQFRLEDAIASLSPRGGTDHALWQSDMQTFRHHGRRLEQARGEVLQAGCGMVAVLTRHAGQWHWEGGEDPRFNDAAIEEQWLRQRIARRTAGEDFDRLQSQPPPMPRLQASN